MVLRAPGRPLEPADLAEPAPADGQVLVRVAACGVCRTDLHIVDGELSEPKLPLVPGHQVVGAAVAGGERFAPGDRIGIPWLGQTCGRCRYCLSERENLCDAPTFTGYQRDGGYAELAVAAEAYAFPLPPGLSDVEVAPLLCAGLIGYRALRMTGDAERLGVYGYGASAHIVCQVARHQGRRVFAFTREGDSEGQELARSLGAEWAGPTASSAASSASRPGTASGAAHSAPEELDAAPGSRSGPRTAAAPPRRPVPRPGAGGRSARRPPPPRRSRRRACSR